MHTKHHRHLLDFPNEILFQIINKNTLDPGDLYALALLSRRLYAIALPAFLSTQEASDPRSLFVATFKRNVSSKKPVPDSISGLAISTDVEVIEHLVCRFLKVNQPLKQLAPLDYLHCKIMQFVRLIQRLRSVSRVEIIFDWYPTHQESNPEIREAITNQALLDWVNCIEPLLNVFIEKGCKSLVFSYGTWMTRSYELGKIDDNTGRRFLQHSIKKPTHLEGRHLKYHRPHIEGYDNSVHVRLSTPASLLGQLTTLSIHSNMLLVPPISSWTISLLHSSKTITSLSFGFIKLSEKCWDMILEPIATATSKKLTEVIFRASCWGLCPGHILRFLGRTPRLKRLEIHLTPIIGPWIPIDQEDLDLEHASIPHLPDLEHLFAPFGIICALTIKSILPFRTPMPKLQCVTVCFLSEGILEDASILALSARYFETIRARIFRKKSQSEIELSIYLEGMSRFSVPYPYEIPGSYDPLVAFKNVTHLKVGMLFFQEDTLLSLSEWVGRIFPNLRRLTADYDLPLKRGSNGLEGEVQDKKLEVISATFRRSCKSLETIEIDTRLFQFDRNESFLVSNWIAAFSTLDSYN